MDSTTVVILSSSSGQMSGQLVKPNCTTERRKVSRWKRIAASEETHVDHAPLAEQVLVAESVAVLVGELEGATDLWPPDASGSRLLALALLQLLLLRLEVEVEADAGDEEERAGLEGEGLRARGGERCRGEKVPRRGQRWRDARLPASGSGSGRTRTGSGLRLQASARGAQSRRIVERGERRRIGERAGGGGEGKRGEERRCAVAVRQYSVRASRQCVQSQGTVAVESAGPSVAPRAVQRATRSRLCPRPAEHSRGQRRPAHTVTRTSYTAPPHSTRTPRAPLPAPLLLTQLSSTSRRPLALAPVQAMADQAPAPAPPAAQDASKKPSTLSVSAPSFVPSASKAIPIAKPPPKQSRKRPAPGSPPLNPTMVPAAPKAPKTNADKDSTRRLIVVLEQACLETYKHSAPPGARGGKGDEKYSLLNCDDHQGVLAKMGRDIAHARPDITHQVRLP